MYHIHYYISGVIKVLEGGTLDINDKYAFDCPPIICKVDWDKLLDKMFSDADKFSKLIEKLLEAKMWETFTDDKCGNYYRNLHGIVEHSHYHLGQMVVIKKILLVRK